MIQGNAITYGDHIDTDVIIAASYLIHGSDIDYLKQYAMERVDPNFHEKISEGSSIIVSGSNFGCGSSRQQAPEVLKAAGIEAVVAESFARIFFRNAINIGLPVFIAPGISAITQEGDRISIDTVAGVVFNQSKSEKIQTTTIPAFMREILENGGLIPHLKKSLLTCKEEMTR